MIIGKEDILSRREEYIGDLFEDDRGERPEVDREMEGPPILKDEIKSSLRRMKYGKAIGPENISVEMLDALENIGINKMESIMNKMHDTGKIPRALARSIFVTLPKTAGAT